jgi:hypothetical protein
MLFSSDGLMVVSRQRVLLMVREDCPLAVGKRVLLLGAGFSRNWGGWLANEALEYLLGCPQVDDDLRMLLMNNKERGFEEALGVLQAAGSTRPSQQLTNMEAALRSMFEDMNKAFLRSPSILETTAEAAASPASCTGSTLTVQRKSSAAAATDDLTPSVRCVDPESNSWYTHEQNATTFGSQEAFNASTSSDEDSHEIPCILDTGRRSCNFRRGHGTGC